MNCEMTTEEKEEVKVKVDEQQHNIKHLLKQCDKEDEENICILDLKIKFRGSFALPLYKDRLACAVGQLQIGEKTNFPPTGQL